MPPAFSAFNVLNYSNPLHRCLHSRLKRRESASNAFFNNFLNSQTSQLPVHWMAQIRRSTAGVLIRLTSLNDPNRIILSYWTHSQISFRHIMLQPFYEYKVCSVSERVYTSFWCARVLRMLKTHGKIWNFKTNSQRLGKVIELPVLIWILRKIGIYLKEFFIIFLNININVTQPVPL